MYLPYNCLINPVMYYMQLLAENKTDYLIDLAQENKSYNKYQSFWTSTLFLLCEVVNLITIYVTRLVADKDYYVCQPLVKNHISLIIRMVFYVIFIVTSFIENPNQILIDSGISLLAENSLAIIFGILLVVVIILSAANAIVTSHFYTFLYKLEFKYYNAFIQGLALTVWLSTFKVIVGSFLFKGHPGCTAGLPVGIFKSQGKQKH